MRAISRKKVMGLFAGICCAVSLMACQSPSPASRIAGNQLLFQSLPAEQQELVKQGLICEGMSPDAVFLAWGRPDSSPFVGQKNGKSVVRWEYTAMEPVMVANNWASPYWGPYGWYGPYGAGTSTAYVPRKVAYVEFTNGKVSSWEARKGQ